MGMEDFGVLSTFVNTFLNFVHSQVHRLTKGRLGNLTMFSLSTFPPKSGLGNLTRFTHLPSSLSVLAHSNYSLVVQSLGVVGWREHILDLVFEVLVTARS